MKKKVKSLGRVRLLVTLWTVARQAPASMGSPRQESGVGCHFLLQGIFWTQELNPGLLHCRQTADCLCFVNYIFSFKTQCHLLCGHGSLFSHHYIEILF